MLVVLGRMISPNVKVKVLALSQLKHLVDGLTDGVYNKKNRHIVLLRSYFLSPLFQRDFLYFSGVFFLAEGFQGACHNPCAVQKEVY